MSTVVETTVTAVEPTQSPTAKEKVGLGVPAALTTLEGFTLFGEPFDPLSLAQREVLFYGFGLPGEVVATGKQRRSPL